MSKSKLFATRPKMDTSKAHKGWFCQPVAVYSLFLGGDTSSNNPKAYGCSGFMWEHKGKTWGLTHGSILFPLIENLSADVRKRFIRSLGGGVNWTGNKEILDQLKLEILGENSSNFPARVVAAWPCPLLSTGFQTLTGSGWHFNDNEANDDLQLTLSTLVVFTPSQTSYDPQRLPVALAALLRQMPLNGITRGSSALAVSTPFAGTLVSLPLEANPKTVDPRLTRASDQKERMDALGGGLPEGSSSGRDGVETAGYHAPFLNSWSEGLVSGTWGPQNVLILTDARTAMGSEGGPLFLITKKGKTCHRWLAGMLLSSMCFWRGECVGFSLACNLGPCLRLYLRRSQMTRTLGSCADPKTDDKQFPLQRILSWPIVQVKCGFSRSSGIPINGELGLILTCAHSVQKPLFVQDRFGIDVSWVKDSEIKTLKGTVIYKAPPGMAYDVGLISVGPGSGLPGIPVSKHLPTQGENVWAISYAMNFGTGLGKEGLMKRPLVSKGIVSAVARGKSPLLQTTCCVQSGSSGGAIISEKDGNLLGMIVSNTAMTLSPRETVKPAVVIFPNINLSVPAIALKPHLEKYYDTKDPLDLNLIHSADQEVQKLWHIENPDPSLCNKSKL